MGFLALLRRRHTDGESQRMWKHGKRAADVRTLQTHSGAGPPASGSTPQGPPAPPERTAPAAPYVLQLEDVPPAFALRGNLLLGGGRGLVLGVPQPRGPPVDLLLTLGAEGTERGCKYGGNAGEPPRPQPGAHLLPAAAAPAAAVAVLRGGRGGGEGGGPRRGGAGRAVVAQDLALPALLPHGGGRAAAHAARGLQPQRHPAAGGGARGPRQRHGGTRRHRRPASVPAPPQRRRMSLRGGAAGGARPGPALCCVRGRRSVPPLGGGAARRRTGGRAVGS